MKPEERAIKWCDESHPLQDARTVRLHAEGFCCSECGGVAHAIAEAVQAERERCAFVSRSVLLIAVDAGDGEGAEAAGMILNTIVDQRIATNDKPVPSVTEVADACRSNP